jgi:hypothetical protein
MVDDPFVIVAEACRRLGLKPREATLLRDCLRARRLVDNGFLLITPGRVPAARRMIARGWLAQSPDQPVPFDPVNFGLVVVAQQQHWEKLIADANATIEAMREEANDG